MSEFDVVVIGAGPGGYVAAIRSAQLGKKTAIVEKEFLGGVCLNVGCIPSKAMISAAHFLHRAQHDAAEMGIEISGEIKVNFPKLLSWKNSVSSKMAQGVGQLLKGNGVTVFMGEAEFTSPNEVQVKSKSGNQNIKAKNFILALGSRPIEIPGFAFDENHVLSSTGALALDKLPKRLAVIGGGYIGLEIGSYLAKLGSQIHVIEATPQLLGGLMDSEATQVVARKLKKNNIDVKLDAKALGWKLVNNSVELKYQIKDKEKTKEETLLVDKVLVTVGRKPNTDQAHLKKAGLAPNSKGFLTVDKQMRTNVPHIFAIGDMVGQPMLAHKASHEGVIAAEVIAGHARVFDAKVIPAVVFTDPEMASAGLTEEQAKAAGFADLKIGKFPFAANGKATSLMETDGFVKVIANAKNNVVLGVHIVGPEASNLISEAALAIEMAARVEDLALTIHPHPTLGETMMEAAEASLGHAIHVIQRPLR